MNILSSSPTAGKGFGVSQQGGDSNTPLNSHLGITAKFDYLQGTGRTDDLPGLLHFLRPGDQEWAVIDFPMRKGVHLYSHKALLPCGGAVHFGRLVSVPDGMVLCGDRLVDESEWDGCYMPGGKGHPAPSYGAGEVFTYWVNLPGGYWSEGCIATQALRMSGLLGQFGLKPTRVDIACDDYNRTVTQGEVAACIREGERLGARCHRHFTKWVHYASGDGTGKVGETVQMGGRRKRVRFYNAEIVHGIPADRWELQLCEDRASAMLTEFSSRYAENLYRDKNGVRDNERWSKDMVKHLLNVAFSAIDFREPKGKEKNIERLPRLPWWEKLCNAVTERVRVPMPKRTTSLAIKDKWFRDGVSTSLAIFCAAMGPKRFYNDYLPSIVGEGRRRLKEVHRGLIDSVRGGYCNEWLAAVE